MYFLTPESKVIEVGGSISSALRTLVGDPSGGWLFIGGIVRAILSIGVVWTFFGTLFARNRCKACGHRWVPSQGLDIQFRNLKTVGIGLILLGLLTLDVVALLAQQSRESAVAEAKLAAEKDSYRPPIVLIVGSRSGGDWQVLYGQGATGATSVDSSTYDLDPSQIGGIGSLGADSDHWIFRVNGHKVAEILSRGYWNDLRSGTNLVLCIGALAALLAGIVLTVIRPMAREEGCPKCHGQDVQAPSNWSAIGLVILVLITGAGVFQYLGSTEVFGVSSVVLIAWMFFNGISRENRCKGCGHRWVPGSQKETPATTAPLAPASVSHVVPQDAIEAHRILCPNCSARLKVEGSLTGSEDCPKCGASFELASSAEWS
jgi:hypothetical protein